MSDIQKTDQQRIVYNRKREAKEPSEPQCNRESENFSLIFFITESKKGIILVAIVTKSAHVLFENKLAEFMRLYGYDGLIMQ